MSSTAFPAGVGAAIDASASARAAASGRSSAASIASPSACAVLRACALRHSFQPAPATISTTASTAIQP